MYIFIQLYFENWRRNFIYDDLTNYSNSLILVRITYNKALTKIEVNWRSFRKETITNLLWKKTIEFTRRFLQMAEAKRSEPYRRYVMLNTHRQRQKYLKKYHYVGYWEISFERKNFTRSPLINPIFEASTLQANYSLSVRRKFLKKFM